MSGSRSELDSVGELYAGHQQWLAGWLRQRLGCQDTAADLVQDTFMRLLARPRLFASDGDARAFLTTVAKGLCVDFWRRHQIEQAWLESVRQLDMAVVPSAERQAIIMETLLELDALFSRLPSRVANAFILSQVQGLTYRQIAEQLEVSERMVKRYMAEAMLHCALLQDDLDDDGDTLLLSEVEDD
ncbi:sigma-70 family RNA polymerase sigma factor [Pokkaliibacter sp. MBI-7]|uniref:sigma-70 family RNA polymerase sigma factor n=1 Tax=Pokkaliibacter sp. MBI-7 TaxID=3040600 RepID=UPI00244769A7|nr:sigma-70 family RNA polymerase sigma factor [Pokkaliibacter sp. MBI-7]MDH2434623.1 sigma-70 family RNA polymerase sigma factor [Pokkaliibacter sp. MBI-7]